MPIPLHVTRGPMDLVDTLLDCHARIREYAGLARKIAAARGIEPAQIASAAADVQRYFRHGLPRHVEDEEQSVVPRLRGRSPECDAALATMEREHREHDPLLARLLALMDQLMAAPQRHAELADAVGAAADAITTAFEHHLVAEEQQILPLLRTQLSSAEQAAILAELRARRTPLPPGAR